MANTFKNSVIPNIGTTATTAYTVPTNTTSTVIGLTLANTTTSLIRVSVTLTDSSTSETAYIVKNAPISNGEASAIIGRDNKVTMEAGDILEVISDTASSADVVVSVLQIS